MPILPQSYFIFWPGFKAVTKHYHCTRNQRLLLQTHPRGTEADLIFLVSIKRERKGRKLLSRTAPQGKFRQTPKILLASPTPTPHSSSAPPPKRFSVRRRAIWTLLSGWGIDLSLSPKPFLSYDSNSGRYHYPSA